MNLQPIQNNISVTTSFEDKISFIKRMRKGESTDRLQANVEQHQQQIAKTFLVKGALETQGREREFSL